ncbi:MAG: magnesium transporter [Myxococcota bacterium]|nr:magnesium transporter [Myxococcota bacterium]
MPNAQETTRILRRLLASGMHARAQRLLARMRPADRGPVLSGLTPPEIRTVIDLLFEQHRAASTLIELPPELLPQVFDALGDQRLADIFQRLELDDRVQLVDCLDPERRDDVVGLLPQSQREELIQIEAYPESSAGRVMITEFVALDVQMTAQAAIDRIRAEGIDSESILYLYVVDDKSRLEGVVPIRRLVAAAPDTRVEDLMIRDPVFVQADADQEEVAQMVGRYNLLAVPVVDEERRILGVITVDDVIEVINEEATEDMYLLAGLSEEDRVFSPAHHAIRKRLPWMLLNLGATFAAAGVVGLFERTLDEIVALAFFMPVVAGMGGNGGIQALTVITRAIALGEIEFSSGLRAVVKEVSVAIVIGAVTGLVSGMLAWLWQGNPVLGAVLFVTMMLTMAVAGILGAVVPLTLKALGQDPAVGSGVFVTTLTDIVGFAAFLGIGTLMLDRLV